MNNILKNEIKILSMELTKHYFGCKIIEENQEIDFNWRTFPKKTAYLLSLIVALKIQNTHNNVDLQSVIQYSSMSIKNYANSLIEQFYFDCQVDYLPKNSLTQKQSFIALTYSITYLSTIKTLIEKHVHHNKKISNNLLNCFFTFLCYKGTTAFENINRNSDFNDKLVIDEEFFSDCFSDSINYFNSLKLSNNFYINRLIEKQTHFVFQKNSEKQIYSFYQNFQ